MTEQKPWITTEELVFFHGRQKVISGINLEFYPGRHYILAGPNGAGKSTLLDLLANLKKAAEGCIIIKNRPIDEYSPIDLARVLALAPQDFRLNFAFTVREVVAMGRRPYLGRWGRLSLEDYQAVDRSIAAVNMEKLASKPVTALSGGEKQRVLAARTIAQETPVILLDEPTSGLDIAHALALMKLAKNKAKDGALVITVTHDLNLAASFGDYFIFLKNGGLAASGPKDSIFRSEILSDIYEAEAQVRHDDFTESPSVSFRL